MYGPQFSREDLVKISNADLISISEYAQELVDAIVTHPSSETCKECTRYLKEHGVVCPAHYHDYQLCVDKHCLRCILCHSFDIEFDETVTKLSSKDHELYKKVVQFIMKKRREYLDGRPEPRSV